MRGQLPVVGRRVVVVGLAMLAASLWVTSALGASTNLSGNVSVGGAPYNKSVPVSSAGQISATISWTAPSSVLTVAVVNPAGTQVALNSTNANPKTVTYNATVTGTYKIRVKAKSGSSAFTGTVTYPGISVPSFAGQIGGGSNGHATMYPSGLDVGPDGTIYVADTGNDQIAAYSQSGTLLWRKGARGNRTAGNYSNPRDLTYLNGDLYVDDTGNNRIQVLDAATGNTIGSPWTGLPSTLGITAGKDSTGNNIILVSEDTSNKIAVYSTTGTLKCTIAVPVLNGKTALPRDAATDAAGNIYVAAYQQDHVDKFPPVVGTTCPQAVNGGWGTSGNGPLQFKRPYGVAVDGSGHVFVADSDNERIQEFNSTGSTLIATFGDKTPANGGSGDFFQLRRVAVANGQVYGADLWGLHIDRFTAPGPTPAQSYPANFAPAPQGVFNEPSGMTFDGNGNLYVADSVNQRIQQFRPGANGASWSNGAMWGARGWGASDLSGFNWPRDISFAPSTNTLWVADTKNNRLLEFHTDGSSTGTSITVGGALTWPYAVDASGGSMIVADTFAAKVESWTGSTRNWSATSSGGTSLKNPYDVAVSKGVVYVADSANKRIVELNAATGADMGSFGAAYLHSPQGVAVDPTNGNIWVSDTSFNKLVEFPAGGGAPIQTVSAPNGAFNHPAHLDVHVDAANHAYLYVADVYNDRIVILDLNEGP
jgi:DNA-binding beta-propeller fold protein YncE